MNAFFHDRRDAGRRLANRMRDYEYRAGLLVLALSRGGVLVASELATHLGARLDFLVVHRLALPCRPELTLGAIAPGGVLVLEHDLMESFDIGGDVLAMVRRQEEAELAHSDRVFRVGRFQSNPAGATVVLVDDGIASVTVARAAICYLRQHVARRIVIATPVISLPAFGTLSPLVDDVIAVAVPAELRSPGEWYGDDRLPDDDQVRVLLSGTSPDSVSSAVPAVNRLSVRRTGDSPLDASQPIHGGTDEYAPR